MLVNNLRQLLDCLSPTKDQKVVGLINYSQKIVILILLLKAIAHLSPIFMYLLFQKVRLFIDQSYKTMHLKPKSKLYFLNSFNLCCMMHFHHLTFAFFHQLLIFIFFILNLLPSISSGPLLLDADMKLLFDLQGYHSDNVLCY